jgi:hypothetical protein
VGLTPLSDSSSFKKIQYFSKVSPQSLYTQSSIENKYAKLSDLYLKSSNTTASYNYGTLRQHNYTVAASNQYKQGLLDKSSVDTLLAYNYNSNGLAKQNFSNEHVELLPSTTTTSDTSIVNNMNASPTVSSISSTAASENSTSQNSIASVTDSKGHSNSLKYTTYSKSNSLNSSSQISDLQAPISSSLPSLDEQESPRTFKFKDLKSPNLGFLSSEKNVRLIDELNPSKFNASMLNGSNNLDSIVRNSIGESITPNMSSIYSSSKND